VETKRRRGSGRRVAVGVAVRGIGVVEAAATAAVVGFAVGVGPPRRVDAVVVVEVVER
jgi:hypothetical protein